MSRNSSIQAAAAPRGQEMFVDVAVAGAGPAGLATAAALLRAKPGLNVHIFERTSMTARGAAILVSVDCRSNMPDHRSRTHGK